jgi:hypothetical protein
MDTIKIKRLVRLAFLLFSVSVIGGIIELYVLIFPGLDKLFNIFTLNLADLSQLGTILSAVPVWPAVLMVLTIALCIYFARYLYKLVCVKIQTQSSR